jgi:TPR repeat protein
LARLYFFGGDNCPKDVAAAFTWASKAANGGDAPSQNLLGFLYENGMGVEQDMSKALLWFRRSAEAGDAKAQASLGRLYFAGTGVERDPVQAYVWLSLSTAQKESTGSVILDELKRSMSPVQVEAAEEALRERQRQKAVDTPGVRQ